jgi:MFS family permease
MFFYIDRTGRRPLLIYGALAMGACHFVVGGILSAGEHVPGGVGGNPNVVIKVTGAKANTVIAFCYLLIIIYALTLAPVCWIYAAEVWSLETRATGMGIAALGNWLFNFALGLCEFTRIFILAVSDPRCRHSARLPEHHLGVVHNLWSSLCPWSDPVLLYLPGDVQQDSRGNRVYVLT